MSTLFDLNFVTCENEAANNSSHLFFRRVYCCNRRQKTETGVKEAQWVVNYEIDIAHAHSLCHNYTSVSYFTRVSGSLGPPLFQNNSGGMQVRMKGGHLLLRQGPHLREIKVRGPSII